MSLTIDGSTNTLTAASGLTVSGNTAVTGTVSASGIISTTAASGITNIVGAGKNAMLVLSKTDLGQAATIQLQLDGADKWSIGTGTGADYTIFNYVTQTTPLTINSATNLVTLTGTLKGSTTIGVGNATPAASGAGVTFPATQSASSDVNTLDDYEEGTWTPTIAGSTTAGTQTYSLQNGYYTKIGNKVFIEYYITMTTKDAATAGDILLVGLPFTSATGGGGVGRGDSWMGHNVLTLSANYYDAYLAMSSANTVAALSQAGSGQGFASIPVSGLAGTSAFRGSFSYTV